MEPIGWACIGGLLTIAAIFVLDEVRRQRRRSERWKADPARRTPTARGKRAVTGRARKKPPTEVYKVPPPPEDEP